MAYSWMSTDKSTFLEAAIAARSALNFSPVRKEISSVFFSSSIKRGAEKSNLNCFNTDILRSFLRHNIALGGSIKFRPEDFLRDFDDFANAQADFFRAINAAQFIVQRLARDLELSGQLHLVCARLDDEYFPVDFGVFSC